MCTYVLKSEHALYIQWAQIADSTKPASYTILIPREERALW